MQAARCAVGLVGLLDEDLGQVAVLAVRDRPADDVAAVDVQDDVEVVVEAAVGSAELGDVLCRPEDYADQRAKSAGHEG